MVRNVRGRRRQECILAPYDGDDDRRMTSKAMEVECSKGGCVLRRARLCALDAVVEKGDAGGKVEWTSKSNEERNLEMVGGKG